MLNGNVDISLNVVVFVVFVLSLFMAVDLVKGFRIVFFNSKEIKFFWFLWGLVYVSIKGIYCRYLR